ncbi:hypothetical protein CAPTEDRAFT_166694 [Capitella teleta]|uniref:Uncharacterized protein n=1 Tax=Capitella teleta TaxID=283909 RepID=R7VM58_CAPTE|nr:hypothetical protein CAPTEDRAFT_166694 [Capitella teleta]|eukprot:ELU18265.1 hypothetical protein CAPTEDRAFT_166694 [Capitella teleta]
MAKRGSTLACTDFPLYTIRTVDERHFLIAGGGGQAKTGISNTIELYELKNDNGTCIANKVKRFDAGIDAVMNSCVFHYKRQLLMAAGVGGKCEVLALRTSIQTLKEHPQGGARQRKGKSEEQPTKLMTFDIESQGTVQTDFSADGGFQKNVKVTTDGSLMATGGADGCMRVWSYPELKELYEVKAHTNEIDDLDISPSGNRITTLSRDGHACVWNTKDGSKHIELNWPKDSSKKYRFRNCGYAVVPGKKKSECVLITSHVPISRSGKPLPCYLSKWNDPKYAPLRIVSAGTEALSALAISDDGIYIGLGSLDGSVSVYITFSLQRLYHLPQAHNIFVTGLEFTPSSALTRQLTGNEDFSLLSISADNQVKLHQEDPPSLWSPLWAIAGFILLIYLLFWFISTYGL